VRESKVENIGFSCTRCGKCCSLEVPIVLSDIELWVKKERYDIISNVVKKKALELLRKHFNLSFYYTLKRKRGSEECIFLKNNICSIYSLRPLVCRLFPFAYSENELSIHPWASKNCEGLGKGEVFSRRELSILRFLAKKIFIELIMLPYYSTFIDEIIEKARKMVGNQ